MKFIDYFFKQLEISVNPKLLKHFRQGIYLVLLLQIHLIFPVKDQILLTKEEFPKVALWLHSPLLNLSNQTTLILLTISLLIGLFSSKILFKIIIASLTLHIHLRMNSITDAGDALLDIWCLSLIFISENKGNVPLRPYKNILNNTVLYVAQFQLCLVYFMAGLGKILSAPWVEGNALIYIFQTPAYSHPFGVFLLNWPLLLIVGNYFTIFFQLAFPFLIWNKKVRPFILIIGTLLHLQISIIMGLLTFGLTMVVSYTIFHEKRTIPSE